MSAILGESRESIELVTPRMGMQQPPRAAITRNGDYVIESTGIFTSEAGASKHLAGGAKTITPPLLTYVILCGTFVSLVVLIVMFFESVLA